MTLIFLRITAMSVWCMFDYLLLYIYNRSGSVQRSAEWVVPFGIKPKTRTHLVPRLDQDLSYLDVKYTSPGQDHKRRGY
jgi:hypothetical protein